MRIGVIAEGGADFAVITNIIKGITGLDSNDIVPLLPKLKSDNTHLAHLDPQTLSSWSKVKNECIERKLIDEFFSLEDSTHLVIHFDTAESHLYEINVPPKSYHQYCSDLRGVMIDKINNWLQNNYLDKILYAIAIEETDAWILTIYDNRESCQILDAKKHLQRTLSKKNNLNSMSNYENFLTISKPLSKLREIKSNKSLEKNCSLRFFYEEVEAKLI